MTLTPFGLYCLLVLLLLLVIAGTLYVAIRRHRRAVKVEQWAQH